MKSVIDKKTSAALNKARAYLKTAKGQRETEGLMKEMYPNQQHTRKRKEFIEFARLLNRLKQLNLSSFLLTWSELAELLYGDAFTNALRKSKDVFIGYVKDHASEMVRLGGQNFLPLKYRFCISPVPQEAFKARWDGQLPDAEELDASYGRSFGKPYVGVYVSTVQNGSVLVAYLNRNRRIGAKIVSNADEVINGTASAGLLSEETKMVFGLSSVQISNTSSEIRISEA